MDYLGQHLATLRTTILHFQLRIEDNQRKVCLLSSFAIPWAQSVTNTCNYLSPKVTLRVTSALFTISSWVSKQIRMESKEENFSKLILLGQQFTDSKSSFYYNIHKGVGLFTTK